MMMQTKKGFTLAELMAVVVIIATMAGLAVPKFIIQMKKVKNQEAINLLWALYAAEQDYFRDYGVYTNDKTKLDVTYSTIKNFSSSVTVGSTTVYGAYTSRLHMHATDDSYTIHIVTTATGEPMVGCTSSTTGLCTQMGLLDINP